MLISRLLHEFRVPTQHFAFVRDVHGNIAGIVTLGGVLKELVGNLIEEFDKEKSQIYKPVDNTHLIGGDAPFDDINTTFNLSLTSSTTDTISDYIVENFGLKLKNGKVLILDENNEAELVEIEGIRVTKSKLNFISPKCVT